MAIDTPSRRASVQAYTYGLMRPVPDGTVSEGDRATVTWLYNGLDYNSPTPGTPGGHLVPPIPGDIRIKQFFTNQGITPTRGIDYEFRLAMALDMSLSEASVLGLSVNDVWLLYKETKGITDESAPFTFPI